MSSFPPRQWVVRYLRDMETLTCEPAESGISMAALLAVRPAPGEEGNFRFAMAGPDKLKLKFSIRDILNSPQFDGMNAEAELDIGDQVQFDKNSVSSPWVDVVDLVRSQDFMITNREDEDVSEEFLTGMTKYKDDLLKKSGRADLAGISIRWVLGLRGDSKRVILFAQVRMKRIFSPISKCVHEKYMFYICSYAICMCNAESLKRSANF